MPISFLLPTKRRKVTQATSRQSLKRWHNWLLPSAADAKSHIVRLAYLAQIARAFKKVGAYHRAQAVVLVATMKKEDKHSSDRRYELADLKTPVDL